MSIQVAHLARNSCSLKLKKKKEEVNVNNVLKMFCLVVSFVVVACGGRIAPEFSEPADDSTIVAKPAPTVPPAPTTPVPPPPAEASPLSVSLSSEVSSNVYVKKEQHAKLIAIQLRAGSHADVMVKSLVLSGRASLSGLWDFVSSDFAKRVTSVAVFNGTTQVGYAKAPDEKTGTAKITNMNLVIPKGSSVTLVVQATLSSTANTSGTDMVLVGIMPNSGSFSEIEAMDAEGKQVEPAISSALNDGGRSAERPGAMGQLTNDPFVVQTIKYSGELAIVAFAHPTSQIVVAGKDAWMPFAQYKASATYEAIDIDRVAVSLVTSVGVKTDPVNFTAIAIGSGGFVKGQGVMPSTGLMDVDLSMNPITVPKDGEVLFQIWVKVAPVTSWSTTSAKSGVSRSGHAPALMLDSDHIDGEWDSAYKGRINARSTGRTSGERVYVNGWAMHGNPIVIRKSQPIVTMLPLSSTTLADIDQDIFKFQVAADSAGSVSWKQIALTITKTKGVSLENYRLRRGLTDMDPSTYQFSSPPDTPSGKPSDTLFISMKFGYEEVLSGSGAVYTVVATVSGAVTGSKVTAGFDFDPSSKIVTGTLGSGPYRDFRISPSDDFGPYRCFLWSDNSEVPHSATLDGSRDWTNGYLIYDITGSVTLTK